MRALFGALIGLLALGGVAHAQTSPSPYGPGGGLPQPVVPTDCLVGVTSSTAAWSSCSGTASTAFSALTGGLANTTAAMVVGTGASLTTSGSGSIVATAVPASALTGTTLAGGVVTSSLTSVGTLSSLTMGGNIALGTNSLTGNFTATGVPILSGLSAGTQVSCLGLDVGNHVVLNASACGSGGGGGTGFGVDGGTSASSVTTSGIIGNSVRLVKVASGWVTGTLTLPAISAVSTDSCIRIEDGGNFVDGTHTLTVAANAVDSINGGSVGGSVGAFTNNGVALAFCVTATHNWNALVSTSIVATTAPTHQFFNSLSGVGVLGSAQPAVGDISGFGTGVPTAAAANLSAAGGLPTVVVPNGQQALGTSAIASNTCATVITISATGVATTDIIDIGYSSDPHGVTGYAPGGGLYIQAYPTANDINILVCNASSGSVTPGALTINYAVRK